MLSGEQGESRISCKGEFQGMLCSIKRGGGEVLLIVVVKTHSTLPPGAPNDTFQWLSVKKALVPFLRNLGLVVKKYRETISCCV